jgi:signal peptidase I
MNYAESKKKLDEIRREYGCKGDIIVRTAIQYVVEYGKNTLLDEKWYKQVTKGIDEKHDEAEKEGKILFCTREFEKALIDCAVALSNVPTYDLLMYIQKEVWLGGDGISYDRAIRLLQNVINYYSEEMEIADLYAELQCMDFDDNEIVELGFEYILDVFEEEEE